MGIVRGSSGTQIDPDWLEERREAFVCSICMMVMAEPTSGCNEGHCCCKACYVSLLARDPRCPVCRSPADMRHLVRNRHLNEVILDARVHCRNWGGADEPGCNWTSTTRDFWGHLERCGWEPVECARSGCGESILRKDAAEHNTTKCAFRPVPCAHCNESQAHGQLAEHEGSCPRARVPCPNEGCGVLLERKDLGKHREGCARETVECPCPGCEVKLLRAEVEAHMDASANEHVRSLMREVSRQRREIGELRVQDSEKDERIADLQKRRDRQIIRKVFTWSTSSWYGTDSECLQFCDGVCAQCSLLPYSGTEGFTHEFSLCFDQLELRVGVHAAFSILDTEDAAILDEDGDPMCVGFGSASSPDEDFTTKKLRRIQFTVTDEQKARALREDGSITMRAVVDVHLLGGRSVAVPGGEEESSVDRLN